MEYVSVKEAAIRLGVGEASIRGYLRNGILQGRKRGVWRWEVNVESLEALEKQQTKYDIPKREEGQ